jgi:hypothetical protein
MTEDLTEASLRAFEFFYHRDHSNAHIHCASVRFSPITLDLAESLSQYGAYITDNYHVREVVEYRAEGKDR